MLDSATKVWTTFAVAKNFGIIHSPLEDYIIRWLRAYPNTYFLEVLPEVSHQIAEGLQNYDLARESFAILVGEEALDSLRHAREPRVHKRTTFGRKKEDLPEHIHTRIEYASKSFLERINNDFADFVVNSMQWIDELPEVRRLAAYRQPELQDTAHKLKDLLKEYVRGLIYKLLCVDYDTVLEADLHHEGGHELLPRLDRASVWANMPLSERILSRTFWESLRLFATLQGASNLDIPSAWISYSRFSKVSHIEKRELGRGTYREIKNTELRTFIRNGQTHLDQAYMPDQSPYKSQLDLEANDWSTPLRTLPNYTIDGAQDHRKSRVSWSRVTPDQKFYDAQRELKGERLTQPSYALPDRTLNGAHDIATNNKASVSTSAQPINIPKPLKRPQDFHDGLSPSVDKHSEIDVRTKWPFGAARDDPVAQVQKSVGSLYMSSLPSDEWSAVDDVLEEPADQGRDSERISTVIDPWRGYSDHLGHADAALQHLALQKAESDQERLGVDRKSSCADYLTRFRELLPKTHLTHPKDVPEKKVALAGSDIGDNYYESDGDEGVRQQIEDLAAEKHGSAAKFFDLERFFDQVENYIKTFAVNKLRFSDHGSLNEPLDLGIVNTLVCLEDSEWKYLPLWAGGNDDGSMGVYTDELPTAEHGFTTAGPEVHDGLTPTNSVKAPSEFELMSAGDSASTFNASTATNRGFSDTIRRGRVHGADSANDSMSDSFTMVTLRVDSDDEETFARKQIEAQERIEEAEEAAASEARRIAKGRGRMVEEDESYADLFDGGEEDDGNDTDRAEVDDEDDEDEDLVMV